MEHAATAPESKQTDSSQTEANYTVVARRYRPRSFQELIGQQHVAHALGTAIATGRVGHAYLFTGARGVGKTSTARIFAKALNVSATDEPASQDIAAAIDSGEDMDVIEIDGASNRGIEEIRQLRANVNVRPSRSRYKIYIIDEVHMLTNQAFNALLKTLEEPPSHVKFIFCTTDPDKIPITVLSRCQRFDFAPVRLEEIQKRLKEISVAEGYEVDDEALALLARRAAGSMRDSQSLLEQVMSFSDGKITVQQVHALLGTADEGRLLAIVETLRDADALRAIALVDEALRAGSDPGQLAEQLLNYLRDLMTTGIGGDSQLLKLANPANHAALAELATDWGLQTILSAIQIVDESLVRMRSSVSATTLLEVALVQICQLEQLASIPDLLSSLTQGASSQSPASPQKKNSERPTTPQLAPGAPSAGVSVSKPPLAAPSGGPTRLAPSAESLSPTPSNLADASNSTKALLANSAASGEIVAKPVTSGSEALVPGPKGRAAPSSPPATANTRPPSSRNQVSSQDVSASAVTTNKPTTQAAVAVAPSSGASQDALESWRSAVQSIDGMLADFALMAVAVEPRGSDHWNIVFPPGAATTSDYCEQSQRKSDLLKAVASRLGRTIQLSFSVMPGEAPKAQAAVPKSTVRAQKLREVASHPYIKQIVETLDGEIVRVDTPSDSTPNPNGMPKSTANA